MPGVYPTDDKVLVGQRAPDQWYAGMPTAMGTGGTAAAATALATPVMGPFAPVAGALMGPFGGLFGSFFEPDPVPVYEELPPPPMVTLPGSAAMQQYAAGAYDQQQQPYAAQYGVQNPYGFR
jgi:hypothetical protein